MSLAGEDLNGGISITLKTYFFLSLTSNRPQGTFPWLWRWGGFGGGVAPPPKPGESALGTRLTWNSYILGILTLTVKNLLSQ